MAGRLGVAELPLQVTALSVPLGAQRSIETPHRIAVLIGLLAQKKLAWLN
jgi:hypothetical protein